MWTLEDEGCYVQGVGNIGKSGGMIGKCKDPQFPIQNTLVEKSEQFYLNAIDFYFPLKTFKKFKESVEYLFKETIEIVDAVYGYRGPTNKHTSRL